MHLYKALISLSALCILVCYAAPVTRDVEVATRDLDDSTERFQRRSGRKPVPNSWIYKTHTNSYTGKEVNKAASNALAHVSLGNKEHKKLSYPAPGSGFNNHDHGDPSGNAHRHDTFHHPIKNKNTDFSHSKAKHEHPPGPDRVIVYKRPGGKKFAADVSYHDPKKPIRVENGAQNHPASAAKLYHPSKTQAKHKKIEAQLFKPPRPANGALPKPKRPSKSSQKAAKFAKHQTKQAQKFGHKKAPKRSKGAQKKAQKK